MMKVTRYDGCIGSQAGIMVISLLVLDYLPQNQERSLKGLPGIKQVNSEGAQTDVNRGSKEAMSAKTA
jgi:hypothetical protein